MLSSKRARAILTALLVTFLWSTSWVLIKCYLDEIPPLIFAGLRYTLAFVVLMPGAVRHRRQVRDLAGRDWGALVALGLVYYTLTQGGQFVTLAHLEAVTFSLLLNFSSVLVAFAGILTLRESPSRLQWIGIGVFIVGVLIYFASDVTWRGRVLGLTLAGLTVCANAAASLLGRWVNRRQTLHPLLVTCITMGIGALCMLALGLVLQGWPSITPGGWLAILWLAVINSALAFTLWNQTLAVLSAVESSIINNTMLIQIAVLAWLFLDERLSVLHLIGLGLAAVGILVVQLRPPAPARVSRGQAQRRFSSNDADAAN